MSFSTRQIGKNLKVFWIDASGTVDLSADRRAFDFTYETETLEMAAGNDTARAYKPTLMALGGELTALYNGTAGTASMSRVKPQSEGTVVWGPDGTATGRPKWGFPAVVKTQNYSYPYPDAIEVTISFDPQGDLSFDGNTAVW